MLNSLPSELILHILAFISPKQVLKYRRLSRRYNSFLLNRAFAVKNLSLFLPKPPTRSTRRTVDFDALWFKWPDVYQRVYCQLHWSQLESFGICQLIGGPLPPAITTIKTLVRIRVLFNHFRGNNICGPLPQDIGSLTSFKRVELQNCDITGSLPASLLSLTYLEYLDLSDCKLSGPLPPFHCHSLQHLNLSKNVSLCGPIPLTLWSLHKLEYLNLSSCFLAGSSIPPLVQSLQQLETLDLSRCGIVGVIPRELGSLRMMKNLNVSYNRLTGNIPSELGNCFWMESLAMNNNGLTGMVPSSLRQLEMIRSVNIFGGNCNIGWDETEFGGTRFGRRLRDDFQWNHRR